MAEHTPAISSSIWQAFTPRSLRLASSWSMSVAGVMGYEPRKRGRPHFSEAMMRPQAVAVLPLMSVYTPGRGSSVSTLYVLTEA